ncbi:MAG: Ig-like domain-containing protein [Bacteroidaceae bacterium]|nr:Ig-like domain-containing protein [Bacteroidaceae bacterium]
MKKIFFFLLAVLCLSTQAYADDVKSATVQPENGRPDHLFTMMSANDVYAGPTTAPATDENGLFAFYSVSGTDNAYHIYSHSAKKWLTYDKAASYDNGKGFIKLSDSKVDGTYFKITKCTGDWANYYEISPVTTSGSTDKYLNWFEGASANAGITLGLWQDNGTKDKGSAYLFTEVIIEDKIYTLDIPEGVTVKINDKEYADGETVSSEGSFDKSLINVTVSENQFAVVAVNDVDKTIVVSVATLPELPAVEKYENAWVYPKQQDNVGVAKISEENDVYVLSNKVLAAGWMKVGNAIYFAGCDAMNLVAGTEPFTVAFGAGDNVPASAMTLKDVKTETLTGKSTAIGGAEHYNGVQLVANYEYEYKGTKIAIVWRAVLRDGSHYIRTEMDLTGVDAVDMFNIIPMIYNVDTEAAGSTPKVVGNTRGATIVSNKIFAGLETPTAYNTVGGATGEEDAWILKDTKSASLTASSWTQVAQNDLPNRVIEATGANYPNVLAYKMANVTLKKNQKVEIEVKYTGGNHRLNFGGADLLDAENNIAASDYHSGYSGGQHSDNTFTFTAPYDGTFAVRVFTENKTEEIDASSTMTVKVYEAKEGVVVNTAVVGIQGRWSRNTTLAAGETWKVAAVVGLIAQDGAQANENIRETQKRRSFLAYSERERAVPWRTFPHYNSWYELNIDRNNAAPGQEHTNFTAAQVLDVISQWKTNYFDKYGEGIVAFVIDDGWDNYGTWTFHSGFPNEMRDIAVKAKELNAGIGAWLGPVGGYGQSGNYRRAYWSSKGGMQLSNPAYYQTYLDAANNLVCQQDGVEGFNPETDSYLFFKYDGISGQFSATGPDSGDTGNENAEGIIRLEQYVREHMREDIFFNTTVGTWASPFWYQISDATWRQEGDYGEAGNNSIDREKWITYRDRLVYQNYVTNSPMCPINTLMTHGFILTKFGAVSKNMDYAPALRELRAAFVCGSGMVELYADYALMNSINNGKLWEDLAECVAWQKKNADVLPDAHWVGGNPWTGSQQQVYGWASWNGTKATLALRNGANNAQTYTFTLREALEIPKNIKGAVILNKSFKVQDALNGLTEGAAIDIDQQLTVTLPASSLFAFDGVNANPAEVPFEVLSTTPTNAEAIETITVTFNSEIAGEFNPNEMSKFMKLKQGDNVASGVSNYVVDGFVLTVTLSNKVVTPGEYKLVIPEGLITRKSDDKAYSGELTFTVKAPEAIASTGVTPSKTVTSLTNIEITFNKEIALVENATASVVLKDVEGNEVAEATCVAEGKVLKVTLDNEVKRNGVMTLVVPEGLICGKVLGEADAYQGGDFTFTIDIYTPRNTGTKTRNDRNITKITVNAWERDLDATEQSQDYLNLADAMEPITVESGETITIDLITNGSWVHPYAYIDYDADGFTAGIKEGSDYEPTGDLVSYSFYNNGKLGEGEDGSGWNSLGTVITGTDRNKPQAPAFAAPEKEGVYRMRLKQDWCSIDPAGDAESAFNDFKGNGGQIIDVLIKVVAPEVPETAIEEVMGEKAATVIYDIAGRKVEKVVTPGFYIVNGKKTFVK